MRLGVNISVGNGGAPKLLDPRNITQLKAWYDGRQTGTNTGQPLVQWNDKSGNNFNMQQLTASKMPTVTADGVYFDGVDDYLDIATPFTITTALICVTYSTTTGFKTVISKGYGLDSNNIRFNNTMYPAGNANDLQSLNSGTKFVNGVEFGPTISTRIIASGERHVYSVYRGISDGLIGAIGAGYVVEPRYMHGTVHEILLYDKALSAEERIEVEVYLKAKWGV